MYKVIYWALMFNVCTKLPRCKYCYIIVYCLLYCKYYYIFFVIYCAKCLPFTLYLILLLWLFITMLLLALLLLASVSYQTNFVV